jgi:hypothetical protein
VTFAGTLFNQAISSLINENSSQADDLAFVTNAPVHTSDLPTSLSDLSDFVALDSPGQTLFQSLLPTDLARRELDERWLKTRAHDVALQRLRTAPQRVVEAKRLAGFV